MCFILILRGTVLLCLTCTFMLTVTFLNGRNCMETMETFLQMRQTRGSTCRENTTKYTFIK